MTPAFGDNLGDPLLIQGGHGANKILGSDANGWAAWKTAVELGLMATPGQVLPSWYAGSHGGAFFTAADGTGVWFTGEHGKVKTAVAGVLPANVFAFDPATFAEPVEFVLAAFVAVNGIAPGLDLKIALRAVTVGGTGGQISYTAGSTLASYTFAAAALAAGDLDTLSLPISEPAIGKYAVTAEWLNGSWLAGSAVSVTAGLQWMPFAT